MASPNPKAPRAPSLTIDRQQIGPILHLRLRGTIDETFSLHGLTEAAVGHVLIDLGRVDRITSFGVRQWMEFTQRLPVGAFGLYLLHAPPVLVDQLNMVEGFAGIAHVLSVLAPYACDTCVEERVRVVDLRTAGEVLASGGLPEFTCPNCGAAMHFADQADEYFSYIRQHTLPLLDPSIDRYLASFGTPRSRDQVNPVKIVQDDLTYFRMGSAVRQDLSVRRLSSGLEGTVVYDLAGVAEVEDGGAQKLKDVLVAASAQAKVVLWRLPPVAVGALKGVEGVPAEVAIANLWLPCECGGCGSSLFQAISSAEYLAATSSSDAPEHPCGVCGAPTKVPLVEGANELLAEHPATEVPYEQIEAVEPKAASQLLHFSTQSEQQPIMGTLDNGAKATPPPEGQAAGPENLQLLKHLGRGGMAEVFLARQVGLMGIEKYVTVKRVLPQFAESPDFVEMLFAEARANARLTHPNVVQIFDVGSIRGVAHITMEYVRGPDLKRVLVMAKKSGSLLPVAHALRIVAETAAGLHYAHTFVDPLGKPHPVIHRDISPHNVLVSLDGAVKLSDFGIAKVNDGGEGTRPGTFKGKINYASPEQACGMPLDARHDLFSLGIVLFESLTGFLPFKGDNDIGTLTAIAQAPTPDPRKAVPSLPDEVVELVMRALAKNPSDRFQTAGEFRQAVEEVMSRQRYHSSPVDVGQYVKDLLGDNLKDFTPQGLTPDALRSSSSPSGISVTPPPTSYTPSGVSQRRPATGEVRPVPGDNQAKTAVLKPGSGARSASGLTPAPRPSSSSGLTPAPRPSSSSGLTPAPRRSVSGTGLTPAGGRTPVPSGTTPRPSASGHTPVPTGTTPRPVATGHTLNPGVTETAQALQPTVEGAPPVDHDPVEDGGASAGKRTPLLVAGAVGAALLVGAGLYFALGRGPAVEISGLRTGEQLFVNGVSVDVSTLKPLPEGTQAVVAVAVDGELRRMGTASVGKTLDLLPLFESSVGAGQTATLTVSTKDPGCTVDIDGKPAANPTPLTTSVPAGKAFDLSVQCGDKPAWMRKILAVPGQGVQVDVDSAAP